MPPNQWNVIIKNDRRSELCSERRIRRGARAGASYPPAQRAATASSTPRVNQTLNGEPPYPNPQRDLRQNTIDKILFCAIIIIMFIIISIILSGDRTVRPAISCHDKIPIRNQFNLWNQNWVTYTWTLYRNCYLYQYEHRK